VSAGVTVVERVWHAIGREGGVQEEAVAHIHHRVVVAGYHEDWRKIRADMAFDR